MSEQAIPGNDGTQPDGGATPATPETPPTGATPDAGGEGSTSSTQAAAGQPAQPEPFAVFPDAASFQKRLDRDTRKAMNDRAKALGFDDWQHMQDEVAAQRQAAQPPENGDGASTSSTNTPAADPPAPPTPTAQDEAARLRMALQVGTEKNLPPALIARLQGATAEEMAADAESLLAVMATGQPRTPGVPGVPRNEQTTTFTRAQLQDPAFVREHAADIQRASREGRIVDA